MTRFGRAPHEPDIGILCANSPQAKGRVERANKTLQDRLAKELRLRGIATIDAANAVLRGFVADHNARFAEPLRGPKDLHRPLSARDDADAALAWRDERTVSNSLTLQYDKVLFLLEPSGFARGLARRRVTVLDHPDGRLEIRFRGRALPCTAFDTLRHVPRGRRRWWSAGASTRRSAPCGRGRTSGKEGGDRSGGDGPPGPARHGRGQARGRAGLRAGPAGGAGAAETRHGGPVPSRPSEPHVRDGLIGRGCAADGCAAKSASGPLAITPALALGNGVDRAAGGGT